MRPDLSKPLPGRSGWRASQRIRLSLLLACCGALALWLALARTGALGHATAGVLCPAAGAPRVVQVTAAELGELRASVTRAVPDRIGRLYEEGTIEGADFWSDDSPSPPPAVAAMPRPGGYEMRWWAPNRDDVVADVLLFRDPAQAREFLARAASPRCRAGIARSIGARRPSGARNLRWVNPDTFAQADVMFTRGPRVYRVAIVPPRARRGGTHARRSASRLQRRRHPRLPAARRRLRARRGVHASMRTACASCAFATRSAVLAVLLAVGASLAGCGGAQGGATGSAAVPPSAIAGGAKQPAGHAALVKTATGPPRHLQPRISAARASGPVSVAAAAEAFAHAVNLTVSDIPGAVARKRESHSESQRRRQREKRALARCLGVQPAREIVDVKSPQLDRGAGIEGESFTSSVTIVKRPLEAEREIEAVRRFDGRPCLGHILRRSLLGDSHGRARLVALRISSLPTHVVGAAASAGLRIAVTLRTARGRRVSLYTDELAFAVGPAEVQLGAFSVAQPVAATTEQELLSLLSQRAHAHPL